MFECFCYDCVQCFWVFDGFLQIVEGVCLYCFDGGFDGVVGGQYQDFQFGLFFFCLLQEFEFSQVWYFQIGDEEVVGFVLEFEQFVFVVVGGLNVIVFGFEGVDYEFVQFWFVVNDENFGYCFVLCEVERL